MYSGDRKRVVITGLGITTALGSGLHTCWKRLIAGESAIRPITRYDCSEYITKVAGEVDCVPKRTGVPDTPWEHCRRSVRLFLPVVQEAFCDAGLDASPIPAKDIGIAAAMSVNYTYMRYLADCFSRRLPGELRTDVDAVSRSGVLHRDFFFRRQGDMIAAVPSRLLGLRGPLVVTDTACAASAHAIGRAWQLICHGKARAMIAGGSAALVCPLGILAFALLGALSRGTTAEASRPFDKRRDGFVMGEGAGAVVLEGLASARARGARIYAELAGFGCTTSGNNLTDPSVNGTWEARAMSLAMNEAGLSPEEIGYIAAHGTSTLKNDINETQAVKSVFGAHARTLMISSNKGHIGHTISAAGVCNLIFSVKAICDGVIPPTINYKTPDPDCDLDYVPNESRRAAVRAALCNAFAFGGQNASLAVKAWG